MNIILISSCPSVTLYDLLMKLLCFFVGFIPRYLSAFVAIISWILFKVFKWLFLLFGNFGNLFLE